MPPLTKRIGKMCLLNFLFFVSLVTSLFGDKMSTQAHFSYAYVQRDCAANDALALNFYFTMKKSGCVKYREPLIEISVVRNLPNSAPSSIDVSGNLATGFRCLTQGACERAISGTLHLSRFVEGKSVSGEYELHFQDGSVEKASFNATWCYIKFVCG
jgi:hypothetical protein